VARKVLSATAWIFAIAAISLGATHALIADSFSSVPAVACMAVALVGFLIGIATNKPPIPVAAVTALSALALIAARFIEENIDTPHSLVPESLLLGSQVLVALVLYSLFVGDLLDKQRTFLQTDSSLASEHGSLCGCTSFSLHWESPETLRRSQQSEASHLALQ
jgi:hypothetical protein